MHENCVVQLKRGIIYRLIEDNEKFNNFKVYIILILPHTLTLFLF